MRAAVDIFGHIRWFHGGQKSLLELTGDIQLPIQSLQVKLLQIAQMFHFEEGGAARVDQGWLDRFGQLILCSQLDPSQNAFKIII